MPQVTRQRGGKQPTAPKSGGARSRWEDIDQMDPWIKMALYGKSGTGKTTLWSSWTKPIGAVICSGAGETKSIRTTPGISANRIEDEADLLDLIEEQRSTGRFKTFVLDHASGYQDLVLKKILNVAELPTQLGWGSATQQQWGELALRMKDNFRALLSLDCHVVIVAQEREFNTDGENGGVLAPYVNCALSPSVAGWLGPNVDYLVETFLRMQTIPKTTKVNGKDVTTNVQTGKVEFCLRTAPHPVYATKFRLPKGTPLPDVIVDPSFDKIERLIKGAK